jgi:hypothetical protein
VAGAAFGAGAAAVGAEPEVDGTTWPGASVDGAVGSVDGGTLSPGTLSIVLSVGTELSDTGVVLSTGTTLVATEAGTLEPFSAAFAASASASASASACADAVSGPISGIIARKPTPAAIPVARRARRAGWGRGV